MQNYTIFHLVPYCPKKINQTEVYAKRYQVENSPKTNQNNKPINKKPNTLNI